MLSPLYISSRPGLRLGHPLGADLVPGPQARGQARHRGQGDAQAAAAGHGQEGGAGGVPLPRLQPPPPRAGQPAPGRQDVSRERGPRSIPPGGAGAGMGHQNSGHIPHRLGSQDSCGHESVSCTKNRNILINTYDADITRINTNDKINVKIFS